MHVPEAKKAVVQDLINSHPCTPHLTLPLQIAMHQAQTTTQAVCHTTRARHTHPTSSPFQVAMRVPEAKKAVVQGLINSHLLRDCIDNQPVPLGMLMEQCSA